MILIFFLYCWNYTKEAPAWRRCVDQVLRLQPPVWRFPHLQPGLPDGWAVGCLQVSCQHQEITGWSSSVIHRNGKLLAYQKHFSLLSCMMIFCGLSSYLLCSCNFKDVAILVTRSFIPTASGLASFMMMRNCSLFNIFHCRIFRIWMTYFTAFCTINFVLFIAGAQMVTAGAVRKIWSHCLSPAPRL